MKLRLFAQLLFLLGSLTIFGDDFQVDIGKKFKSPPSNNDLISGIPFLSNLKLQAGDLFKLTDGKGKKDYGMRTFALDNVEDWVVTFSKLKIVRLDEVRVFSWNGDHRAQQDFDITYSINNGKTYATLAKEIIATENGVCNLTRIPCRVDGVTDLRFTFRNPGDRVNTQNPWHSSILEIDAIGVPLLPLTFAEAKKAGRDNSILLHKAESNLVHEAVSNGQAPQPNLAEFKKNIEPALKETCVQCHGPDKQKGKFRIDTLDPDLLHGGDVAWWLEVQDVISNGEMPPDDADQSLGDVARGKVVNWLASEIQTASQLRRSQGGHSSFRRMTRYEYNYALQDLLGLPNDFARDLPPETNSEDGFKNSSEMLQMSVMQFEQYREIARKALSLATVEESDKKPVYFGVSIEELAARSMFIHEQKLERIRKAHKDDPVELNKQLEKSLLKNKPTPANAHFWNIKNDLRVRSQWGRGSWRSKYSVAPTMTPPSIPQNFPVVAVIPMNQSLTVDVWDVLPDTGIIKVRVLAARSSTENKSSPTLGLLLGHQVSNNSFASEKVGSDQEILSVPGKPQFYEWTFPLSEVVRNPFRNVEELNGRVNPAEYLRFLNTSSLKEEITLQFVEVIAPFYEQWPPDSHRKVFPACTDGSNLVTDARKIILKFMEKAWRRPVTLDEIDRKVALFTNFRKAEIGFQNAIIETLSTVLSSPHFLYLVRTGKPQGSQSNQLQNDFELATRLSVFLWASLPDEELFELAVRGELNGSKSLVAQVKRMLADPKAERFIEHFVRQWLGMDLLDYLEVDKKAYPRFDSALKDAMRKEPVAFFREVLSTNGSVLDFLHSDYAMMNERLAKHYGIPEVYGTKLRKVSLKTADNRGGLISQAGLLAMNSDGKDSHPLKRGVWLLESLLNDPPPPPPPAVPEIDLADPEILKLSLKERMEDHRNDPACISCHAKIDPWGIAFENFDATGAWRSAVGKEPVDASSLLYNKQELNGMDGLKRFLLENRQDQFALSLTHKMASYALGRPLTFGDQAEINQVASDLRRTGDGLADLVFLIVKSDLFRQP